MYRETFLQRKASVYALQAAGARHGLVISGGSDSHHPHQELARIDPDELRVAPGMAMIVERVGTRLPLVGGNS